MGVRGPGVAFALENAVRAPLGDASAGVDSALEKAVRAASVRHPPVRSKRLFKSAFQDHYSKAQDSGTLCSAPLCSALLAPCMDMHTSISIIICILILGLRGGVKLPINNLKRPIYSFALTQVVACRRPIVLTTAIACASRSLGNISPSGTSGYTRQRPIGDWAWGPQMR